MRIFRLSVLAGFVALQAFLISGCANKPIAPIDRSRTSVVLLPDEDGKVGSVVVSSAHGEQRIAAAYDMTTVGAELGGTPAVTRTSEAAVRTTYRPVLDAAPARPVTFTLYFELGTTRLTPASKRQLPSLFETARSRTPTEISIYGHSDSIGSDKRNVRLSELRAKSIEKLLRHHDPEINSIDVKFLGDREPLVPTPDNVPEPRNRRAEVVVL